MYKKAVFPGQYIQGKGAVNQLYSLIKLFGSKGLILGSQSVKNKIIPRYFSKDISDDIPFELFSGECCEDELLRLSAIIKKLSIRASGCALLRT